jgi:hypothetical protein
MNASLYYSSHIGCGYAAHGMEPFLLLALLAPIMQGATA